MKRYLNLSQEDRARLLDAYHGKSSCMKITLIPGKNVSFDTTFSVYDLYSTNLDVIAVYPHNKKED